MAKLFTSDACSLPAWQAIELATINGAKALNVSDKLGSLEIGKSADIVAVDLNHVSTTPVHDPIAQIVSSATRQQVSDVWVDGVQRVKQKVLVNCDVNKIIADAQLWADQIKTEKS